MCTRVLRPLREVHGEARQLAGLALEAERCQVAHEGVGEALPLADHEEQRPLALVHQRGLRQDPGVDRVEHELQLHGLVEHGALLGEEGLKPTDATVPALPRELVHPSTSGPHQFSLRRMALIALTLSLLVAVVGAVGIVVPGSLLAIAGLFLTPAGLYAAALVRLVLGTALYMAAPSSRAPTTIRILRVVIIVGGLVTPLVGVERARLIVHWWAAHGTGFLRAWAGMALGLRLFLAYAVAHRTSCVHRR